MKAKRARFLSIATLITLIIIAFNPCESLSDEDLPYRIGQEFIYRVNFNGIYVGKIEWEYMGQSNINDELANVLCLSSNAKILKLFSVETEEKLYISSKTHLPLKVERNVEYFGKKEKILEEYNQDENYVKITKISSSRTRQKTIRRKDPIHNIIAFLFFFPDDMDLKLGKSFTFNLPTQKIYMKVTAIKLLDTSKGSHEVFILEGGPRKFKVWLEKEKRFPLRIEFPFMLNTITISKIN